ncbi:MAG TPA: PDZ domain-containing protein [Gammaproteobacteria bacterium]
MLFRIALGSLAAALAGGAPAAAQPPQGVAGVVPLLAQNSPPDEQAEREQAAREQAARERTEREQAERERTEREQAERERKESELQRARAELERAAREVARLSQELAAPIVRRFSFAQQRAMLGLSIEDDERGVRVRGVSPNGPAAAAGVQAGDVIVAIDGALLPTGEQSPSQALLAQMTHVEPGEDVMLEIVRDGERREVTVRPRAMRAWEWLPDADVDWEPRYFFFRDDAWRSMELVALTPELGSYFGTERGILVVRGPGREGIDLRDGDVILDIGGREPSSPEHAMRILRSFEPGETLRMNIMRQQRRQTLEIELPAADRRQ